MVTWWPVSENDIADLVGSGDNKSDLVARPWR